MSKQTAESNKMITLYAAIQLGLMIINKTKIKMSTGRYYLQRPTAADPTRLTADICSNESVASFKVFAQCAVMKTLYDKIPPAE